MKTFRAQQQPLRVHVGEEIAIELDGLPGAGYEWTLAPAKGVRVTPDGWSLDEQANSIGGASRQRFRVIAERSGVYRIECVYKRSWEDAVEQRRTITLRADAGKP